MIPIVIPHTHTTVRTENLRYYECRFCGFEDKVLVGAVGLGTATGFASSEAEGYARDAARVDENLMLKLCPCPKCGRRDASGFIARSVFTMLAVAAFAAGIIAMAVALFGGSSANQDIFFMVLAFNGLLGAGVFGLVLWYHLAKWSNASRSVLFGVTGSQAQPQP